MGENALRFMLIGIIFIPLVLASNMLYQSIRKSEIASVLAMLRSGIIFIPLILMLESTIGFTGIEIAQPISDVFAGLFSIPFIRNNINNCKIILEGKEHNLIPFLYIENNVSYINTFEIKLKIIKEI